MLENTWVSIPAGEMVYRVRHRIMEGDCQVEHGPVPVKLPAFQMTHFPITNGMYAAFVAETGYQPTPEGNFLAHLQEGMEGRENQPVVFVSLEDAQAYARYAGGSLPSEAQWQYAAGGPQGLAWPWGNAFDPAKTNGDGGVFCDVDAHPEAASPFGICDLTGNAWEWVGDAVDDGAHLFGLLRGGCCYRAAHFWHMQGGPHPTDSHMKMPLLGGDLNRAATVGFRCVREVKA